MKSNLKKPNSTLYLHEMINAKMSPDFYMEAITGLISPSVVTPKFIKIIHTCGLFYICNPDCRMVVGDLPRTTTKEKFNNLYRSYRLYVREQYYQ